MWVVLFDIVMFSNEESYGMSRKQFVEDCTVVLCAFIKLSAFLPTLSRKEELARFLPSFLVLGRTLQYIIVDWEIFVLKIFRVKIFPIK